MEERRDGEKRDEKGREEKKKGKRKREREERGIVENKNKRDAILYDAGTRARTKAHTYGRPIPLVPPEDL